MNSKENNMASATNTNALSRKRMILYIVITFVITYLFEFLIIWPLANSTNTGLQVLAQLLIAAVMFIPAISVIITRLITKEGFKASYLKPKTGKKSIPYFLMGWFGPAILTILGAVVYFLVYPKRFDPEMGYLSTLMIAQGVEPTSELVQMTFISQAVTGILLGPLLNFVNCFGEEWGWRGYLLPKMLEHFKLLPTLLIGGVIWGLWHMPITMLGHNYGLGYPGYPFKGILAMCLFCIVIGAFFTYLTVRTGSCLPATFAHGSLNGFASIGLAFTHGGVGFTDGFDINPFVGPAPTGIIGGSAFLLCAVVVTILMLKNKSEQS